MGNQWDYWDGARQMWEAINAIAIPRFNKGQGRIVQRQRAECVLENDADADVGDILEILDIVEALASVLGWGYFKKCFRE